MVGLACTLFFGAAGSSKADYFSESAELGSATEIANPDIVVFAGKKNIPPGKGPKK